MKKLLLTALMLILPLVGCEKEDKEKCDCDQCPCEQIRDAEPEMEGGEMSDMGLEQEGGSEEEQGGEEAGAEQEDLPVGGQDASEAGEMMPEEDCGEMPEDEEMCVPEMMPEEDPEDDDVVDCECESSEDCEC